MGIVVGGCTFAAGKPVQGRRSGPGPCKDVVRRLINQGTALAVRFLIQHHICVINNRRSFTVVPVYTDTACRCDIITVVRSIVILRNRFIPAKIPVLFGFTVAESFVCFFCRPAHQILQGIRDIAFCLVPRLIPLVYRIQALMVFRIGNAFHRYSVNSTVARRFYGDILSGDTALGCAYRSFCPQPGRCICLTVYKLPVHTADFSPFRCHLTGRSQCVLCFNPVFFFNTFIFVIAVFGIGNRNRSALPIISNFRYRGCIQPVNAYTRPCRSCGFRTAQSQTTHKIECCQLIVCQQGNLVRSRQRRFIINQHQAVAAPVLYIQRAGQTASVRFAATDNNTVIFCFHISINVNAAVPSAIRRPGLHFHIFTDQNHTIRRNILPGNAGADSRTVSLRISQPFAAVTRTADYFRFGLGVDVDIFSGLKDRLLPNGNDPLVFQVRNIYRGRDGCCVTRLVSVKGIAAHIVVSVRGGIQIIGQILYDFFQIVSNVQAILNFTGKERTKTGQCIDLISSSFCCTDGAILQLFFYIYRILLPFRQLAGIFSNLLEMRYQLVPMLL